MQLSSREKYIFPRPARNHKHVHSSNHHTCTQLYRWVVSHGNPEKMFPSNVLISLEAEKNPLSLIENPHKSPFRNFFYDHSKVELFSFLCSNFYKKILSITRQRKDATAVAQLTLFLNARVSYHKCHTHNKLDAFWCRFTKQVLKFIRWSVCLANWYRKIQLTYIIGLIV